MWVDHSWPFCVHPWWSGWMHQIVTGVTLDTSVPSTLLVEKMLVQFCTENTYVIAMLCANFKMIQWLCKSMWTNEFMQAFSSRWALTYRLYCYIALIFPLTVTLVVSIHALSWLSPLRVMEGLAAVCMAEVLGEGNQVQVAGMEKPIYIYKYIYGLVQDCGKCSALALELHPFCIKLLIYRWLSVRLW